MSKKYNNLDGLILPGEVEVAVNDSTIIAGASGTPVNVDEEAEPAPASGINDVDDAEIDAALGNLKSYKKMERISEGVDSINAKLGSVSRKATSVSNKVTTFTSKLDKANERLCNMEAAYLVTQPQVKEFEDEFLSHFTDGLKKQAEKIVGDAIWKMDHERKEQVSKFTYEIKGGFWMSTKCTLALVAVIITSYVIAGICCYVKWKSVF
ncbi:MAG: hypothetical protein Q4E26_00435 [Prevotellaceae bacterium]|nr:hypothetical protein [Prevotellaceae bacterium]